VTLGEKHVTNNGNTKNCL